MTTSQYVISYFDSIHLETGIPTYKSHSSQLIATTHEKGMRAPHDHPRRMTLDTDLLHCESGRLAVRKLPKAYLGRNPCPIFIPKPWSQGQKKLAHRYHRVDQDQRETNPPGNRPPELRTGDIHRRVMHRRDHKRRRCFSHHIRTSIQPSRGRGLPGTAASPACKTRNTERSTSAWTGLPLTSHALTTV